MEYLDFHRFIIVYVLSAVRIGAAMAICPALSDSMIMGFARRVAVLAFAFILVPMTEKGLPIGESSLILLGLTALKEAVIGLLLGFFASIPFWIAENVGNFIDNQRGATMGEVYSPLSGTQVSSTGIFFTQIVSTIFFVSGAIFLFLGAIYSSFRIIPLFSEGLSFNTNAANFLLSALDGMLKDTVVISAPIIILMFLATIGLGFVNRTAPQLNVFFLSMPVKCALGIAMLIIYLPFIIDKLMYTKESTILIPVLKILN